MLSWFFEIICWARCVCVCMCVCVCVCMCVKVHSNTLAMAKWVQRSGVENLHLNSPHRKSEPLPLWLPYSTSRALCVSMPRYRIPDMSFWKNFVNQQPVCKALQPKQTFTRPLSWVYTTLGALGLSPESNFLHLKPHMHMLSWFFEIICWARCVWLCVFVWMWKPSCSSWCSHSVLFVCFGVVW